VELKWKTQTVLFGILHRYLILQGRDLGNGMCRSVNMEYNKKMCLKSQKKVFKRTLIKMVKMHLKFKNALKTEQFKKLTIVSYL